MIAIDGQSLTLAEFSDVVHDGAVCALADDARTRVEAARRTVEESVRRGDATYGINTGFGDLSRMRIEKANLAALQERLILSHSAGLGEPLPDAVVRGMLLLRANTLARGHSGVRASLIEALLGLLNAGVLPLVPSRGSVGASGDLAPLAHLALPLIGRGEVRVEGRVLPAREGLARAGLAPLALEPKEGVSLINGTQAMTSLLALSVLECRRLVRIADLVAAMATDALRGTDAAFDARLHRLRPYPGQRASAANIWKLMQGSGIRESHRQGDVRIQDPYSVRCAPQVHGAVRDLLADVEAKLAIEMNSVTDNPLIFPDDDEVVSGGNFHGEPMALAADVLTLGVSELGAISERRIEKLTNTAFSGLPPFLTPDAGLNSGFMMAQVSAAALASENKTLSHPASVDSIPTSADKEDHVSMGMGAALKLRCVVANTSRIIAIELAAAAQGIDLLRPLRSSAPLEALHEAFRRRVPMLKEDREMAPILNTARAFLDDIDGFIEGLE
ncbi:MAG: histidine ammonia-lyase [Gammaproteobacteria bacterium]|nr:histidine ammonia-lyase [Gammaproteobacteria bacterium]NIM74867.1 histidine ammonia-lyase [Gammaproteobacteria bacterium]NIN39459.1 histidine ammonia-lyase [Gammaproteobacteria bacterium]NIO26785.1 histidine ammonia-lyase [Gammaproteobacteria bacterium]NIO67341.1 histidine ammonia-lyase [Gammaproteobacteria bacterium]